MNDTVIYYSRKWRGVKVYSICASVGSCLILRRIFDMRVQPVGYRTLSYCILADYLKQKFYWRRFDIEELSSYLTTEREKLVSFVPLFVIYDVDGEEACLHSSSVSQTSYSCADNWRNLVLILWLLWCCNGWMRLVTFEGNGMSLFLLSNCGHFIQDVMKKVFRFINVGNYIVFLWNFCKISGVLEDVY